MHIETSFRDQIAQDEPCLGTCISFADAAVTEALATVFDFVWIDMEHSPLSLETVQSHLMATAGAGCTSLVRVPWNDPVLIKPVLDIGASGVIVPLIRSADDARHAVAACRYPPDGIRGYGPRRAVAYRRDVGPEYCRKANESIVTIVQIEHVDALNNLDDILAVPGLTSIVVGPNDLAGSLGHMGQPGHQDVQAAIDTVIARSKQAGIPMGLATGGEPDVLLAWAEKGVKWFSIGADWLLLLRSASQLCEPVRSRYRSQR